MKEKLKSTLSSTTRKLIEALENVAELRVETRYVIAGEKPNEAAGDGNLLARTVVQADGDTQVVIPMTRGDAGELQVDNELFDLHMRSVTVALNYRSSLLSTFIDAVNSLR